MKRRSSKAFVIPVSANLTRVEAERELRFAMQDCADAHERGDSALADAKLRQALALAEQLGDTRRLRLLRAMAQDGPDGKPVVRPGVSNGRIQQIGLDATRTGPVPDDPVDADTGPRRDTGVCPNCHRPLVAPDAKFCEPCGAKIGAEGAG